MPLEKAKLKAERKRYAMLSSTMFLVVLAMIAGLAYVSFDNNWKKNKIESQQAEIRATKDSLEKSNMELEEKKKELETANRALIAAEVSYENFVDSIIQSGNQAQRENAMSVKNRAHQISTKISTDKQTQQDLEKIEKLADDLDGNTQEWTEKEIEQKKTEYEEIQRRNPYVEAVVKANKELEDKETKIISKTSKSVQQLSEMASDKMEVYTSQKGIWIKEGYSKVHGEDKKLKIALEKLANGEASVTCSFPESKRIKPWTFSIKEGEERRFDKGNVEVLVHFLRVGAAGRNPLKKAMYYEVGVVNKKRGQ